MKDNEIEDLEFLFKTENGNLADSNAAKCSHIMYYCPGCKSYHLLAIAGRTDEKPCWTFDGNAARPTLSPSVLSRGSRVCHHYLKAGRIQFLNDCTHELKGQTVDICPEK